MLMNKIKISFFLLYFLGFAGTCMSSNIPSDSLKHSGDQCIMTDRYIEALDFYTSAVKQAEIENNEDIRLASLGNIGNVYAHFKDYEQALHYYHTIYSEAENLKKSVISRKSVNNIIGCLCLLGKPEEAKKYIKILSNIPSDNSVEEHFMLLQNQATIAEAEKNYRTALTLNQEARDFAIAHNLGQTFVCTTMVSIGEDYMQLGDCDAASNAFYSVLETSNKQRMSEMRYKALTGLADVYRKLGQTDSAAIYLNMATILSDSIYNQQRFNNAKNKLFEYEAELTKQEIISLNSRITSLFWVIAIILILVIVIATFTVVTFRQKRSLSMAYRVLVEKNEEQLRRNERSNVDKDQMGDQADNQLMPQEQALQLLDKITHVMETSQAVYDQEFSLPVLAKMVDSNTKYVSWVINDTYRKNFKSYLNEYRIREASRMLTDPNQYGNITTQAIGEMVGYKSHASFIDAFKKNLGMTPATYQKLSREKE